MERLSKKSRIAILIAGHGTAKGDDVFYKIAKLVEEKTNIKTSVGYVACKPTVRDSLKELIKSGYKEIVVVPLFLVAGSHVLEDIPKMIGIKRKCSDFENVKIYYARHIGADYRLAEVVIDRVKEVLDTGAKSEGFS